MHHQIRLQSRFKGKQTPNVESLSANKILIASDPQIQRLTPSGANRNVTLPDPATLAGHWYLIGNPTGASYAVVVKKSDASTLITLAAGEQALLLHTGTDFVVMASTDVDFGSTGFKADVLAESTSGTGVTVDGLLIKDGLVNSNEFVRATIAVADATGGATTAALTLDLYRLDGTTAITAAKQVMIVAHSTQYDPGVVDSSPTFGTATKGSIIASGSGWCLCQTSAAGEFDCTVTNATDETLYFSVRSANSGIGTVGNYCIVAGSNSDAAVWSA